MPHRAATATDESADPEYRAAAADDPIPARIPGLIGSMHSTYGPYAFGIVSLVVLHFVVFKPMIDSARVDKTALDNVVSGMNQVMHGLEATSRTLERVVEKINH